MTIQEKQQSMHEKDLQRLNELCLMDDDFFSEALDGKKDAVEYILKFAQGSGVRGIEGYICNFYYRE